MLRLSSLTDKSIEQQSPRTRSASIEPKRVFVEIIVKMLFRSSPLICSAQPPFEERRNSMWARHENVSRIRRIGQHSNFMVEAPGLKRSITFPPICLDDSAGFNHFTHKTHETVRRNIWDPTQSNSAQSFAHDHPVLSHQHSFHQLV